MFFRFSWKWNKFGVFNGVSKEKENKDGKFSRIPKSCAAYHYHYHYHYHHYPPASKQTNKQTNKHTNAQTKNELKLEKKKN